MKQRLDLVVPGTLSPKSSRIEENGNNQSVIQSSIMFLKPDGVMKLALGFFNIDSCTMSEATATRTFVKLLGSYPIDIAQIWYDLMDRIPKAEKTLKGFKYFIATHHFLWAYPKNATLFATTVPICERNLTGNNIHVWVERIASLKDKKIVWPSKHFNDSAKEKIILNVDGTNFRQQEKKHHQYNQDSKEWLFKFKRCACKFEIGLMIHESKVVWLNGPWRGGKSDLTIFEESLVHKIPEGKYIIADSGYSSKKKWMKDKVLLPQPNEAKIYPELYNFKCRARC